MTAVSELTYSQALTLLFTASLCAGLALYAIIFSCQIALECYKQTRVVRAVYTVRGDPHVHLINIPRAQRAGAVGPAIPV